MRIDSKKVRKGHGDTVWLAVVMFMVLWLLHPITVCAQWEQAASLMTTPDSVYTSYTNARCIAVNGDYVHAIWTEKSWNLWQTAYKRSTDGGVTWQQKIDLCAPSTPYMGQYPSIAAAGSEVHVVWHDERDGNQVVYHRGSSDNGATWGVEQPLTSESVSSRYPAVAVSGRHVYAAWAEVNVSGESIYFRFSSDGGATWQGETAIAERNNSVSSAIAVSGSTVHIVWYDQRNTYYDVYYRRSTDDGSTWEEERRMTESPANSNGISIDTDGEDVHLVWHDMEGGSWNVHYMNSRNGGVTWGTNQWITNTSAMSYNPNVAVSGQRVHIAWVDLGKGRDILYTSSSDAGDSWRTVDALTTATSKAYSPKMCISGDIVHVLWTDAHKSVQYRRNPTGNLLTNQEGLHALPSGYALSQNYPNPFCESSSIRFTLPLESRTLITLHDMLGRRIATLAEGDWGVGEHILRIDGAALPSGNYICRMQAGAVSLSRMLSLIQR